MMRIAMRRYIYVTLHKFITAIMQYKLQNNRQKDEKLKLNSKK